MKKQLALVWVLLSFIAMNNAMYRESHDYLGQIDEQEQNKWRHILDLSKDVSCNELHYTRIERCKDFGFINPENTTIQDVIKKGVDYCAELGLKNTSLEEINEVRSYMNTTLPTSEESAYFFDCYRRLIIMLSFPAIKKTIDQALAIKKPVDRDLGIKEANDENILYAQLAGLNASNSSQLMQPKTLETSEQMMQRYESLFELPYFKIYFKGDL